MLYDPNTFKDCALDELLVLRDLAVKAFVAYVGNVQIEDLIKLGVLIEAKRCMQVEDATPPGEEVTDG